MTDRLAARRREGVRAFALTLPGAVEEFPWGESAIKVRGKVFVFLGTPGGSPAAAMVLKLTAGDSHAHALSMPGAGPAGYGLGRSGWVRVPLTGAGGEAPEDELLRDWVEDSYRVVAPRRLVAELDAAAGDSGPSDTRRA
ncbi:MULTISPECIES: MmcQ/YjbR family DNA-binding protein [Streptomyces]|uniref:MmcQ/YjbR family DNA-binding protein n=1 Tax=Streptomyces TaxID=1883 RepID=UPI000CD58433|nr:MULTISPECIES: MmcQ/YjbR family DNA-binding protein [Streptomyces]